MRYLRENTATRVTVGPFIDKTDGFTPEIALTVTAELLTFVVDDAGVPTLVLDVAPTASGGANDMVHITSDAAGFYDLELAAANVNYTGRAILSLNDVATHLPVWHEFQILSANVYDSLVTDGDVLDVSAIQINGGAIPTPAITGVPDVNVTHQGDGAIPAPAATGVPDVNMTHVADSAPAATNLGASSKAIIPFTVTGTPSSTSMDTDITGYADGSLVGREVVFDGEGGTADGQPAEILTYTSTDGVITYLALNITAVSGDSGVVV